MRVTFIERFMVGCTLLLSLAIAPLSVMSMPYTNSGPALAIIPPWADREATLMKSGLTEIGPVRAPFGVLVQPNPSIDLATLRENGIWTLLDGSLIAAICGVENV